MAQRKKTQRSKAKKASPAKKHAMLGANTARHPAEKVVRLSNDAMKDMLSTGAGEAQKTQEKLFSISRDSADKMAKSADAATKMMYDAIATSRDSIETAIECGNMTAALAKDLSSELFENANQSFSDGVETTKELFACRTINDMMELNNRLFRQASENLFNQSAKISERVFEYANEAIEPINERVAQVSQQLNKALKN
jgi:hypothetical protein